MRRDRPASPGHRLGRPHRLQRAVQFAGLADAHQDARPANDRGQRPVLRPLEDVPIYAITMGVGTILEAGKIILVANGENKAAAVAAAVEGPVTSMITASALQLHPDCTFFLDRAAASKLQMVDYYRWIQAEAPTRREREDRQEKSVAFRSAKAARTFAERKATIRERDPLSLAKRRYDHLRKTSPCD